ncbi:hypothetical protein mvi_44870 [Methylobacterium indicum]|nr:hypothetical protein mvi_44870 [Methylobacterium indicum]
MQAIAAAVRRSARNRDADATEHGCLIIPFPKRPMPSALRPATGEAGLLQVGA